MDIRKAITENLKANQDYIKNLTLDADIEKGGKPAAMGEKRMFGDKWYHKTSKGWRPVPASEQHKASQENPNVKVGNDGIFEYHGKNSLVMYSKPGESKEDFVKRAEGGKKEEPKKEEKKEKTPFQDYDVKKEIGYTIAYIKTLKELGIDRPWTMDKDQRDYVGDKKKEEVLKIVKDKIGDAPVHGPSALSNFKNVNFNGPHFSYSDFESMEKNPKSIEWHAHGGTDYVTEKVRAAGALLHQPHVLDHISKLNNFCEKNNLTCNIDYTGVHTSDNKSGAVSFNFYSKNWRDDDTKFSIKATYDRGGNVDYHELNDDLAKSFPNNETSGEGVRRYKGMEKFSKELNSNHKERGAIDEQWAGLKEKYDNYYDRDNYRGNEQPYSQLSKVDQNTIRFTAGDIGKKKSLHETIRDAERLSPPSKIGDYKIVSNQVYNHMTKKMEDRSDVVKQMLKSEDKYHEYENNIDFTYVYKKG